MDNIELIKKFPHCSIWVAQQFDGTLMYAFAKAEDEPAFTDWLWDSLKHLLDCKVAQQEHAFTSGEGFESLPVVIPFLREFTGNQDIRRAADCLAYGRKCRKRGMIQTALEYEAKGEKGLSKALGYTISDALLTAWETTSSRVHPKELNEWSDFL
jgi:hypothetical protein